jgi:hypothetical protein
MNMPRYRQNRESRRRSGAIDIRSSRGALKAGASARATARDTMEEDARSFAQLVAQSISQQAALCVTRNSLWPTRLSALLKRVIGWLRGRVLQRKPRRKLQLLEIQPLGEKRFVALVRAGRQKFLIGGAASSVALLAELQGSRTRSAASRQLERT